MAGMTQVAFHFNVPALPDHVCRLLRKATLAGHRVWVLAPQDRLHELDALLWTFSQEAFIAHAIDTPQTQAQVPRSAVVLSGAMPAEAAGRSLLVNLQSTVPEGFDRFDRVIELVTDDPDQKEAARQRWRQYRQSGFEIEQHDLAQRVKPD